MTTTNMFTGLGDGQRSSSKVLRPPGGGSSNIFGGDTSENKPAQSKPYQKTSLFGSEPAQPTTPSTRAQRPTGAASAPFASDAAPAPAPAPVRAREEKENPIAPTPPPQAAQPAESAKPKPRKTNPITGETIEYSPDVQKNSTRIRQPPGGASSGLW